MRSGYCLPISQKLTFSGDRNVNSPHPLKIIVPDSLALILFFLPSVPPWIAIECSSSSIGLKTLLFAEASRMRLIALNGLPVTLLLCASLAATDSAMFRGDPQHSGAYSSPPIQRFSRVKWKFHTNGMVLSSPAVSVGMVYFGSTDGRLYALDSASGQEKWRFETKSRITSSPAVANGVVYFGAYNGLFYAVDAANGKLKWQFETLGEHRYVGTHLHGSQPVAEPMPDPFDFYLSSPVIWNGAVFFGSGDGNIYNLNAASGAVNWKFKTGDVVHASPAIANGTVFIGSWDSYFYALDVATGKEKWRFKTGEDAKIHNQVGIKSSAAVVDGMVYFGCRDSNFYALNAATGEKKWSFPNDGSWVITSPAVADGTVYFATSDSGVFCARNSKTGTPIFSLKFQGWPMFSSPAIVGDMIYIGSHSGQLLAINRTSHQQTWKFQTDGSKQNGPAYTKSDGTPKYEAAFSSDFYDDMVIGVGRMLTVGAILSSPVVADRIIYVGSSDGNLYALM
jgi:outer membrane protein assembly factor BamB